MSRASLVTLVVCLALGLGAGLYIGWVVAPVQYVDTAPASLSQTYKDDYVLMIAAIYSENGDLAAAFNATTPEMQPYLLPPANQTPRTP